MQRSASIPIVSKGLTPTGLGIMAASTTISPSRRSSVFPERIKVSILLEGIFFHKVQFCQGYEGTLSNEEWSRISSKVFSVVFWLIGRCPWLYERDLIDCIIRQAL